MNKLRHVCTYVTIVAMMCLNSFAVMPLSVSADDEPTVSESTVSEPEMSENTEPEPEVSEVIESEPAASEESDGIETYADTSDFDDLEGNGTSDVPYQISSKDDIIILAAAVNGGNNCANKYFELGKDIQESLTAPIITGEFSGNFNGKGKTIEISKNESGGNDIGLFRRIGRGGEVIDLNVKFAIEKGGSNIGGIAVENDGIIKGCSYSSNIVNAVGNVGGIAAVNNGTIENCSYSGNIIYCGGNVGGIAAENNGTIKNCYLSGNITCSGDYIGGIAGKNHNIITLCHASGNIKSSGNFVGGIAGYNYNSGAVEKCYNTCYVEGANNIGGVVGYNNAARVENCYNTCFVKGYKYVGGVVGYNNSATVRYCYNIGDIGGGFVGGVVGTNQGGTVDNCYYLIDKADNAADGDSDSSGAVCITAEKFADQATFITWDNSGVWQMSGLQIRPLLKDNVENNVGRLPVPDSALNDMFSGSGTADDPYLINNINDLKNLRDFVNSGNAAKNKSFKLTNNITISDNNWEPIGVYVRDNISEWKPFAGIFDGGAGDKKYEIKNMNITSKIDGAGLFGNNAGIIKNLGIRNGSVTGLNDIGSIAGYNSGTIERCYNEYCTVDGRDRAGGIVGNNAGTVKICYNTGNVTSPVSAKLRNGSVGGIAGDNSGTIEDCYNTGDVSGFQYIGGVVGFLSGDGKVSRSYNIGDVSSQRTVGGVIGYNGQNITSCFYLEGCVTTANIDNKDEKTIIDNNGTAISEREFENQSLFEDNNKWFFKGTADNYIWIMLEKPVGKNFLRPVFGYHPEVPPGAEYEEENGSETTDQDSSGSVGGGYYPWFPPLINNNDSNSDENEDDVSSAAGVLEDSSFIEGAVPVIGIIIPIAVSSVLIIKLRRRKE